MARKEGRGAEALRRIRITPGFVGTAAGSCLMETGGTRVIVTASVEPGVPLFLKGKGQGWLTAEYAMLPASTGRRKQRTASSATAGGGDQPAHRPQPPPGGGPEAPGIHDDG